MTIEFNPAKYSEPVLRLILAAAQKWQCTPGEAETRILEQRARKEGFVSQPGDRPRPPEKSGDR